MYVVPKSIYGWYSHYSWQFAKNVMGWWKNFQSLPTSISEQTNPPQKDSDSMNVEPKVLTCHVFKAFIIKSNVFSAEFLNYWKHHAPQNSQEINLCRSLCLS